MDQILSEEERYKKYIEELQQKRQKQRTYQQNFYKKMKETGVNKYYTKKGYSNKKKDMPSLEEVNKELNEKEEKRKTRKRGQMKKQTKKELEEENDKLKKQLEKINTLNPTI